MSCRLILFVALALICRATTFPLSSLFVASSDVYFPLIATQLLSLHDGTYLALVDPFFSFSRRELNPLVRTLPSLNEDLVFERLQSNIVARIHPTNDSVIWAYVLNDFDGPAFAVVDGARNFFIVGQAAAYSTFAGGYPDGFRVLRFSIDGEIIWGKRFNTVTTGITDFSFFSFGGLARPAVPNLAGSRTLVIGSDAVQLADGRSLEKAAFFVDTITRKLRQFRFPLPDGPPGDTLNAQAAADSVSGAACFAYVETSRNAFSTQRLFVQCANAAGGSEAVSRVLAPFEDNTTYDSHHLIMANEDEGKAATLYVVAVRGSEVYQKGSVSRNPSAPSEETMYVSELLVFKLNPTTLEDVEWESGLISMKSTMRKLLIAGNGSYDAVNSLEYIRDRNTLVVLFVTRTVLDGIETLPDGTIVFRGNSSIAAERSADCQWLLYFGNDPEPAAVRIPDDPRPNGEQNDYDYLNTADLELSEDKRSLYLYGTLEEVARSRFGGLITFPFPLPKLTKPSATSLATGDDLGDGVDESFEPSPDETVDASMDEELMASPNPLQERDI